MQLGMTIATWFISLFPDWDAPAEVVNFDSTINGFIGGFSGLGVWAPWPLVIFCAVASVGAWVIGLTIKAVRAIAAHIPLVGGAG